MKLSGTYFQKAYNLLTKPSVSLADIIYVAPEISYDFLVSIILFSMLIKESDFTKTIIGYTSRHLYELKLVKITIENTLEDGSLIRQITNILNTDNFKK